MEFPQISVAVYEKGQSVEYETDNKSKDSYSFFFFSSKDAFNWAIEDFVLEFDFESLMATAVNTMTTFHHQKTVKY